MTRRDELRARLSRFGLAPNRRLGQNFMVDGSALTCLVATLEAGTGEQVVEIGPGTGLLTERLLAAGLSVLAVELDRGLVTCLQEIFAEDLVAGRLTLVHGDALASKNRLHPAIEAVAAGGAWSLAANLPYDISLPVILNACQVPRPPRCMAVTVQYDAARRLCAAPGDPAWGASAAIAQAAGSGRLVRRLPPNVFEPRPRVDSAILRWDPVRALPAGFSRWCRDVFAYRRKRVVRALRDAGLAADRARIVAQDVGVGEERRLETCAVDELLALHAAWCHVAAIPEEESS